MSHFNCLVIFPDPEDANVPVDELIETLMLPFHEFEVTGIKRYLEFKDFTDEWRKQFESNEPNEHLEGKSYKEYYAEFDKFVDKYHGGECRDDNRVGYITNPNYRWDWYQLGGRWNGFYSNYNPEDDPRNWEDPCKICKGTGVHSTKKGKECAYCRGKGKALVWPSAFIATPEHDVLPVKQVQRLITHEDEKKRQSSPFAFVLPEEVDERPSTWVERGTMGWWGCVSDEVSDKHWGHQVTQILNKYQKNFCAVVDCHI